MISNRLVRNFSKELGFDLCGFARYEELTEESDRLEQWLECGYQAGMLYMERNRDKRRDIRQVFPEAVSVISLGCNYFTPFSHGSDEQGKISRYAWGVDYHLIMWERLATLIEKLQEIDPEFKAMAYVDTGPVMDKVWAVKAGIGWQGKNSNIISPGQGSWFFLATILTNTEFEYSHILADHCGTCRACIDACPTNAIVADQVIDANKCISYLTIENKGDIPEDFSGKFDNWLFGCDVCQDVCPWNKKFSMSTDITEFFPENEKISIIPQKVLQLTPEEFKEQFAVSPIKRSKISGLQRNAAFLLKENERQ
ncbi:MAG: tRNA epoxyqueuosine(34) reductase QueG [Ignavibacteria bacterium]|nr:tRNA epoxyqueuosine(34) reductase QueG [Ignavibacteria bacterium]